VAPKIRSEADWEAENDANTIARAAEIQADKKRLMRAAKAAKRLQDEAKAKAKGMAKLAKKAKPAKPAKKAKPAKPAKKKAAPKRKAGRKPARKKR
jgi:hypothetical protein